MSIPTPPHLAEQMAATLAAMAEGTGLRVPPPVFEDMQVAVQDYRPGAEGTHLGARLVARIPVQERYQNPMGHMQGGVLAAAADNVIGPLSYLVAPPSSTAQLAMTYLAPVTPEMAYVEVAATLTHRAGRQLIIDAEISGPDGALLAVARATQVVVRRPAPASAGAPA